jgi:hypothetical protein
MPTQSKREIAEQEARWAANRLRIEKQRTLWAMTYPNAAKDRLKEAMLQRAWDLLDSGSEGGAEACDALLEFLPADDAEKLLNELFRDTDT